MNDLSKRMSRMLAWIDANPCEIYADYHDTISDDQAAMILAGEFDSFWESTWEAEWQMTDYPEFWDYWESEFASEFGFDSWSDVSDTIKEFAYENRAVDSSDFWRSCVRNYDAKVNAVLMKRDGELIYAPANSWGMDSQDTRLAHYIKRAFDVKLPRRHETQAQDILAAIEPIYGGYDMECAVLCGTVDLWEILESRIVPTHVEVTPQDSDNLLWYEFFNGAGNMGSIPIGKTRKFRASFHLDGTRGYGIDSCYGFCGSFWQNEMTVYGKESKI
jgi:hypothetical protein